MSDLFVAQMIGHSSPSILQTYAKAIDEYRRDAVRILRDAGCTLSLAACSPYIH